MIFTSWSERYSWNDFPREWMALFGFTHLGRANVRRLAGAQKSVGGINTVAGLIMNRGGLWWGVGLSLLPQPNQELAAQNDSGGDVLNGFVTIAFKVDDSLVGSHCSRQTLLSSKSATVITKGGKMVMVVGTPGGSRITTATLLTILNVIDYRMNIQEAVDAPRFHQQWLPEETNLEDYAVSPDTRKILEGWGHKFVGPQPLNHMAAILVGAPSLDGQPIGNNRYYGANDLRLTSFAQLNGTRRSMKLGGYIRLLDDFWRLKRRLFCVFSRSRKMLNVQRFDLYGWQALLVHDIADVPCQTRCCHKAGDHRPLSHPRLKLRGEQLFLNPGSAGRRRFKLPVTLALLEVSATSTDPRCSTKEWAP
jgi:hypothetical protein